MREARQQYTRLQNTRILDGRAFGDADAGETSAFSGN